MSIANRQHHRRNAADQQDIAPDRIISQADRVSLGGGYRSYWETSAINCTLISAPTVNLRLFTKPTVNVSLGSQP